MSTCSLCVDNQGLSFLERRKWFRTKYLAILKPPPYSRNLCSPIGRTLGLLIWRTSAELQCRRSELNLYILEGAFRLHPVIAQENSSIAISACIKGSEH